MLRSAHTVFRQETRAQGFFFDRPLLLLQSDDWGRVGVRDREGFDELRSAGLKLGEKPYDFYTLETAEDVAAVGEVLNRHQDCTGRPACLEMNFILANVDFERSSIQAFRKTYLTYLHDGLPGNWRRPGLFEAYASGIDEGVFYPALHGVNHFCRPAIMRALSQENERGQLLRTLWQAGTPYIYWRMPWIGYEYWDPERSSARFLPAEMQEQMIQEAVSAFTKFFLTPPISACAPGYRANADTHGAWVKAGIRVAQNGTGAMAPPRMDRHGVLQVTRTIDFEPAVNPSFSVQKSLLTADECFARGIPLIISVHAINFHSSVKDFRSATLLLLDRFLLCLEQKYPNLLYLHDSDLWNLVNTGKYEHAHGSVSVRVKQQSCEAHPLAAGQGA